jgi:hypothetical protein
VKVKELINKLKDLEQDKEILIQDFNNKTVNDIQEIVHIQYLDLDMFVIKY